MVKVLQAISPIIYPISPMQVDLNDANNRTEIALLSIASKVFLNTVQRKINDCPVHGQKTSQCSTRVNRSDFHTLQHHWIIWLAIFSRWLHYWLLKPLDSVDQESKWGIHKLLHPREDSSNFLQRASMRSQCTRVRSQLAQQQFQSETGLHYFTICVHLCYWFHHEMSRGIMYQRLAQEFS